MKKDNPANRIFLNSTALVIFLPILALAMLFPLLGMFNRVRMLFENGRWFDYPIVIFLSGLYITSVVLIFWRSRLSLGLCVFYLTFFLMLLHPMITKLELDDLVNRYVLEIGRGSHIHGVDVYCNDVYLGQTPLVISEEDFRRKVKPWNQPPRQNIIIGAWGMASYEGIPDSPRFLYYAPSDYFEQFRTDRRPPYASRQSRFWWRETFRKTRYWWHFEKDGCVGVAPIEGDGGAGGGQTITINADPKILYLSVKPHLELLLHSLRRWRYEPTDEWVAHFRRYSGLLFHKFYQKAQRDPQLTRALYAVVKTEFGIDDGMSDRNVARVVDEILERVERVGTFSIPSPESVALDLLGKRASKAVEKRFVDLASVPIGRGKGSKHEAGQVRTSYRQGRAARLLPLEYAIRQIRPPGLFNRLVYESHRGSRFISLVSSYRREEAVRLVRRYLQDAANARGIFKLSRIFEATAVASQIRNPELEGDSLRFMRDNADPHGLLIAFLESRFNSPVTDADSLARWIFQLTTLTERDKLEYLSRVNSPRAYNHIQALIRGDYERQQVIESLEERPNPALDQFLIDSYEYYQVPSTALVQAMLVCDTPKMRAYLDELWNEGTNEREFLLEDMSQIEQGDTRLVRWTKPISELTEPSLRLLTAPVLSLIDTSEAVAILASWAAEPDEQLSTVAQEHLDNYRKRGHQAAELIAGKIKPDDLLPPQTQYVWDGQDYVLDLASTDMK